MPTGGHGGGVSRSYSSKDMDDTEPASVRGRGLTGRPFTDRTGPKHWSVVVLSVVCSAVAVAAVGCLCALIYPILKGKPLVGSICCVFSWTLTYFDSHQPGIVFQTLTLDHFRDVSDHGFHMGYGVAVLNGITAMLTVAWSLT
ncbi:ADP-ribosylation factor-like protein 6-interacting protein 6 [Collichthys lucidus]|uniref:ADP-ribosylation factor-like protein 6-interacting protein 6 n=1 Tax=Collichthys lucidus TaxID=240159 RepID=A0A4U5UIU6_COLLU|nr:ADP-ribosylation factor-like protein 6-interacting protein 6 [Collichthys lucidus]